MNSIYLIGVNYKQTDISIRNKFAFTEKQIEFIYEQEFNWFNDIFILSTCNRTEIYSTQNKPEQLTKIFEKYAAASNEEINNFVFEKSGNNAINHLFEVTAGLDSQILGDNEIVSQVKKAFSLAKQFCCISGYMEKIITLALHASKTIKANTNISNGNTSISYAVAKAIQTEFYNENNKNICLVGLGKIGSATLASLKKHLCSYNITLVNRTEEKSKELSEKFGVEYVPYENVLTAIQHAQILIIATNSNNPIVNKEILKNSNVNLIIDLTVPSNIDDDVYELKNINFINIDYLSKTINKTLHKKQNEIPAAKEIIKQHLMELRSWLVRKQHYTTKILCN